MKILGIGLTVLAVIIGVFFFFVANNAGALVEAAIEEAGPAQLGVSIEIDEIDLSFTEGVAEVRGVVVGNPPGFEGPYSVRVDRTLVALSPEDISGEVIRIKRIAVDGADVAVVANGLDTNLQVIADRAVSDDENPVSGSSVVETPEVRVIVEQLDFTNASASLTSDLLAATSISIPDVHLTNVGSGEGGATMGEVAKQLLAPIVSAISRELIRSQGADAIKGKLDEVREDLDLDRLKDKAEETLKDIDKDDVVNALDRLINRD